MPFESREHAGHRYTVQFTYALPDDAWRVKLSEAVPAPASWGDIPGAETHLSGPAFMVTVVPDEDPEREPTIHIHSSDEHVVLFEVMHWFLKKVAEEVQRCRAGLVEENSRADG